MGDQGNGSAVLLVAQEGLVGDLAPAGLDLDPANAQARCAGKALDRERVALCLARRPDIESANLADEGHDGQQVGAAEDVQMVVEGSRGVDNLGDLARRLTDDDVIPRRGCRRRVEWRPNYVVLGEFRDGVLCLCLLMHRHFHRSRSRGRDQRRSHPEPSTRRGCLARGPRRRGRAR
jgi:hypothetical protein